jgi:hypothetical protein
MRVLMSLFALAALSLPAAAQGPGCTQANPCDLIVDVDASGLDFAQSTFTTGDWVVLSVFNSDAVPHTVSLSGHSVSLVVAPDDIAESEPFRMGRAGTYELRDSPSGDRAAIVVEAAESFTSDGEANGLPGLTLASMVAVLAALAFAFRRK